MDWIPSGNDNKKKIKTEEDHENRWEKGFTLYIPFQIIFATGST